MISDAATPRQLPLSACMDCGWQGALLVNTPLHLNFDPGLIPQALREKFTTRHDGVCLGCGLYQDFLRFNDDELQAFADFNKDETVSESSLRSFPVPTAAIEKFDENYSTQRIGRWRRYFEANSRRPRRCLFLRPMFGATMAFARDLWSCDILAIEISRACRRTCEIRVPEAKFLDLQIQGQIQATVTEFGPFDAIFVFHTLVHCADVHNALDVLSTALTPGGVLVLSQEIQMKPQNPFHLFFPTEPQLIRILESHFASVERIDSCDPHPPEFITTHTLRADSPDFIAHL